MNSTLLPMTAETYELILKAAPVGDALERVNCKLAGTLGHSDCGWNYCRNMPNFMTSRHHSDCKCKQQER